MRSMVDYYWPIRGVSKRRRRRWDCSGQEFFQVIIETNVDDAGAVFQFIFDTTNRVNQFEFMGHPPRSVLFCGFNWEAGQAHAFMSCCYRSHGFDIRVLDSVEIVKEFCIYESVDNSSFRCVRVFEGGPDDPRS